MLVGRDGHIISARTFSPIRVDVFGWFGQSNGVGVGNSALSPVVPPGRGFMWTGTAMAHLADPVVGFNGPALTGSLYPSFGNAWYAEAGCAPVIVQACAGSTSLLPDGNPADNWSPTSPTGIQRRDVALNYLNAALAFIQSSRAFTLNNVYIGWVQGESDALAINGVTTTGPLYKEGLKELADYYAAHIPNLKAMGVVRTGTQVGGGNDDDFEEIRQAQEDACAEHSLLTMLYRDTVHFPLFGWMHDGLHYNQSGLNDIGTRSAAAFPL